MEGPPPSAGSPQETSAWQPLSHVAAACAPDTYGVVLVADARRELILVTHGVIREEAWRILNDPLAKANGAAYFRYTVTLFDKEAQRAAEEMFRESEGSGKTRLRWRTFAGR